MCNSPLELPSVHFLCSHSFHQHCFESYAESEAECPTCTPENRKVMDMLRAQDQKRDLHDHFNRQVTTFDTIQNDTIAWHARSRARQSDSRRSKPSLISCRSLNTDIHLKCLSSLSQLRSSSDGFSVVADYFGRGVFNKLTLVTDPPGSKPVGSLEVNLQRDLLIHTKRNC